MNVRLSSGRATAQRTNVPRWISDDITEMSLFYGARLTQIFNGTTSAMCMSVLRYKQFLSLQNF